MWQSICDFDQVPPFWVMDPSTSSTLKNERLKELSHLIGRHKRASEGEQNFSVRLILSACVPCPFLIRRMRLFLGEIRSIGRKVLWMYKTCNKLHWTKYDSCALACVLFVPPLFLVLYLSNLHPLPDGAVACQAVSRPVANQVHRISTDAKFLPD